MLNKVSFDRESILAFDLTPDQTMRFVLRNKVFCKDHACRITFLSITFFVQTCLGDFTWIHGLFYRPDSNQGSENPKFRTHFVTCITLNWIKTWADEQTHVLVLECFPFRGFYTVYMFILSYPCTFPQASSCHYPKVISVDPFVRI